ncbi:MAG: hypothetical protein CMJ94_05450 [Planctomycetes bacterium]|nr:hypothetical protein [Planctomycetota bacterium]
MSDRSLILPLALAALLGAMATRFLAPAPVQAQSADGDRRYVAVAAEYQTGVSLLYVLDQQTERLAVYEARGGASNSHRLALVGVRNVGLDTQLDGFNDESDYSFKELEELLERRGVPIED